MAASIGILSGLFWNQAGLAVLEPPPAMLRPRPLELLESPSDLVAPGPFLLTGTNLIELAVALAAEKLAAAAASKEKKNRKLKKTHKKLSQN